MFIPHRARSSRIIAKDFSARSVSNTGSQFSLTDTSASETFIIPANVLSVDGDVAAMMIGGSVLNATGSNQTILWVVKLNENVIFTAAVAPSISTAANRRDLAISVELMRVSGSALRCRIRVDYSNSGGLGATTGTAYGTLSSNLAGNASAADVPFDPTTSNTIQVLATMSTASESMIVEATDRVLRFVPA